MTNPDSPEVTAAPDTRASRYAWAALVALALAAAFAAINRVPGCRVVPSALDQRQARAVALIAPATEDERDPIEATSPEGRVLAFSAPSFDRAAGIRLAVRLDADRQSVVDGVARLRALLTIGADTEGLPGRILETRRDAEAELCAYLGIEPERARIVLSALGWPWTGASSDGAPPETFGPPFPGRPAPLADLTHAEWQSLLKSADPARPWREAAQSPALVGLRDAQIEALRAYLGRRAVVHALDSARAQRDAVLALAWLADLAPLQARTVLAMDAARELVDAGREGIVPLIGLLEREPELGRALLVECVRRAAVAEIGLVAAAQLGGSHAAEARRTLLALGPFGAEAARAATRYASPDARNALDDVVAHIESEWPPGPALETLGTDPVLWRQWYAAAEDVL